ncbi:restriction endonuclease subunit S [Streptomyces sp. NPDC014724]|uniref:restriction endonuclease subunit S n=1 Tax=unclassified Streptomyces TaxID=2593676 RepID=UPI0036FFAB52
MRAETEFHFTPIRDLGEVRMGKQLSPASREGAGQAPYLRVANVFDGRIDFSDVKYMSFTRAELATYSLRPGDILLNEGQSLELVGRSALYDGPDGAYCFQNTLVRFRPGPLVLPEYAQIVFSRWLSTGVFSAIAKKTTSIAHMGGDRFASLCFPLVALEEQRRIVASISAVENAEQSTRRQISKLRIIRQARINSFVGAPEASGEVGVLGDRLTRIDAGRSPDLPNQPAAAGGWGVLKVSAVRAEGFRPQENKALNDMSLLDKQYEVHDGDLLMSRANTPELVGASCIAKTAASRLLLSDKTLRLVEDSDLADRSFVNLFLSSSAARIQISNAASGSSRSMQNISQRAIFGISLVWPSLTNQQRFVREIDAFDNSILIADGELGKFRIIRQGVLESFFGKENSKTFQPRPAGRG